MTEKRYSHDGVVIIDHLKKDLIYIDGKENLLELAEYVDKLQEETEQLKQFNNEAIELILEGIVEMHDGKRDYAETLFNKAIKLLKGDVE